MEYMASKETKELNSRLEGKVVSEYRLYKHDDHELVILSFTDGSKLELKSKVIYDDLDNEHISAIDKTLSYVVSLEF